MSKAKPEEAEKGVPEAGESEQSTPPEDAAPETPETGDDPQDQQSDEQSQLETALQEAGEYRDQAMRAHAELENVRKRAQRDVESARKFALEKFATELLGVRDSLEMGLQAAEQENGTLEGLKEGTELTLKMFGGAMEKFGVEVVNPEGETFNPEFHEAMSMQESADHPANTVIHVMQKGYSLNGRVLRPAMVMVSKRPAEGEDSGKKS